MHSLLLAYVPIEEGLARPEAAKPGEDGASLAPRVYSRPAATTLRVNSKYHCQCGIRPLADTSLGLRMRLLPRNQIFVATVLLDLFHSEKGGRRGMTRKHLEFATPSRLKKGKN
jgi:hypothetical protein